MALTVTENAVGIRRVQSQMEELEKKMTDMHNMIKTAVLGSSCFSLFFLGAFHCCSCYMSLSRSVALLYLACARPPDPRDSFLYALTLSHVLLVWA